MDSHHTMQTSILYNIQGTSQIELVISDSKIKILHTKDDPADISSFAEIYKILLDDISFNQQDLQNGTFYPNLDLHLDAPRSICPCLYFGYIGEFIFYIEDDLYLQKIKQHPDFDITKDIRSYNLWKKICDSLN